MQIGDQKVIMVEDYSQMIRGKRSKRPRPASPSLALTIANSLSSGDDGGGGGVAVDLFGSSDPWSGGINHNIDDEEEEEDMANCLILLAGGRNQLISSPPSRSAVSAAVGGEIYRCKTCDRTFSSFQALGGHTASHKKPIKPISAAAEEIKNLLTESVDGTILSLKMNPSSQEYKSRVHECSTCGAEFASGQALGGHMRRHRPLPPPESRGIGICQDSEKPRNLLSLDLNLPAAEEQAIVVFSASPMVVNCHY